MVLESTQRILVVHRERPLSVIDSERLSVPIAIDQVSFDISILEQLENCYDLLVLDWHLEQPDARGVLDAFRQTAPESWVLALAAEVPDDDPVDRGVDEVLVEPVAPTALAGTLERLLFQCAYERTMHNLFRLSTERASSRPNSSRMWLSGISISPLYRSYRPVVSVQRRFVRNCQETRSTRRFDSCLVSDKRSR